MSPTSPTSPSPTLARRPRCPGLSSTCTIGGIRRQEAAVRKVRPKQEEQVALGECPISTAPAEETGHPDGIGVVRLEDVLPAVGVADRRVEQLCELQHFLACVSAALAAEDHGTARCREVLSQPVEVGIRRTDPGSALRQRPTAGRLLDLHDADVAGQDDHPDTTLQDRSLHGEFGQPRHLAWRGDVARRTACSRRR